MKRVLLFGLLVVCCFTSFSQTGVLDQTFGDSGKIVLGDIDGGSLKDLFIQPDGKIVAAGISNSMSSFEEGEVVRILPNGKLDNSYA